MTDNNSAAMDRLRYYVAQTLHETVMTPSGIEKPKTKKQREIETAVATEVVRFAFDHAGIQGNEENLAPGGLYLQLLSECGFKVGGK